MARRRFGGFRRKARRSSGFSRRRGRSRGNNGGGTQDALWRVGGGFAYGALRERLSQWASPITSKIPAGEYADEVGLGLLAYGIGRFFPKARVLTNAVLTVEGARLGAGIAGGIASGGGDSMAVTTPVSYQRYYG